MLENLINQLVASFMSKRDDQSSNSTRSDQGDKGTEGGQNKTEEAKQ